MQPRLTDDKVYIWQVCFDLFYNRLSEIKRILSEKEIKRAEQFYFEKDRKRFIVHRGFLKKLLSSYLNILPSDIKFNYQKLGKPFIYKNPPIFFNSSHSNNIGLFAVSGAGSVGVDVERIRCVTDIKLLTKRFFAPEECRLLFLLQEKKRLKKFFEIWTLKEAYLKATGEGLASGLKDVAIKFDEQKKPTLFYKKKMLSDWQWTINRFTLTDNYPGAIVVKANKVKTIFLQADASFFNSC
ncbi:MAG: 4'-phosphopantetheinyl transferase superfamily protein [Deltaproteobacteria bacterium]|nr:4'-phosphopantetheinyl transferase superfamily protein [Deltaproteobacteria bacterium]